MNNHRIYQALIVEDETLNISLLSYLLADHFPYIQVAGIARSLQEARILLKSNPIDLLFLDVELPDGNGFDLLSDLPEVHFEVIVITAYSTYMLDAIRHSALDFIIKPVTQVELGHTLSRFLKRCEARTTSTNKESQRSPQCRKLPLPTQEGYVFVNFDNIVHAEAGRCYSVFSLTDRTKIIVSKPLVNFEERLLNHDFFRVHKSHIINLGQIVRYVRGEGGHVVMATDITVPVSRHRKDDFLKIISSL